MQGRLIIKTKSEEVFVLMGLIYKFMLNLVSQFHMLQLL